MNGHCDVKRFSCQQTQQNGALSIVNNKAMLAISKDSASVGFVHESIAIFSVPEELINTVNGPDVILDAMLCTPDMELAHVDILCRIRLFVVPYPAKVGCLLLNKSFLLCRLSSNVAWNSRW